MANYNRKTGTKIKDFLGLQTNVDPFDRPPGGMKKQKNFTCTTRGKLTGRRGLRAVTWEN